jgi:hypothetical protein
VVRSGGAIWIGGSRSGEADCWAREAVFKPIAPKDARTVEASRLLLRKTAETKAVHMRKPRQDVGGTSQRTRFHKSPEPPVKRMSVVPDRHLRV